MVDVKYAAVNRGERAGTSGSATRQVGRNPGAEEPPSYSGALVSIFNAPPGRRRGQAVDCGP